MDKDAEGDSQTEVRIQAGASQDVDRPREGNPPEHEPAPGAVDEYPALQVPLSISHPPAVINNVLPVSMRAVCTHLSARPAGGSGSHACEGPASSGSNGCTRGPLLPHVSMMRESQ